MSEAAFTLSTAPIWAALPVRVFTALNGVLTSLFNLGANRRKFDEYHIPERRLRVVGNGHYS